MSDDEDVSFDAEDSSKIAGWSMPFAPATPRRPKKRRHRLGWGPFRSAERERSVAFNLTLDVQHLHQEIQQLEAKRTALQFKALNLRHSPEGSLMKIVREHFRLFRRGYCIDPVPNRPIQEREQRAFIFSVMDERLDCGNGLYGPQVMTEQIRNYSTFLRYISLDLHQFDIAVADDAIIISTKASLHFQILRNTIAMIFPHILGHEDLVSRLVGQELAPVGKITYYFNAQNKCFRYEAELDFVGMFLQLLDHPHDVALLLGHALIAENSMFGVEDAAVEDPAQGDQVDRIVFPAPPSRLVRKSETGLALDPAFEPHGGVLEHNTRDVDTTGEFHDSNEDKSPRQHLSRVVVHAHDRTSSVYDDPHAVLAEIVDNYFAVFSCNADETARSVVPLASQEFLAKSFSRDTQIDSGTVPHRIERRWSKLYAAFDVLSFRQILPNSATFDPGDGSCVIETAAEYKLHISQRTLDSVFPRVSLSSAMAQDLLGSDIIVESELVFWLDMSTGKVSRMTERMDFETALKRLFLHPDDVMLLLSQAWSAKDGVEEAEQGQQLADHGGTAFFGL